jgi:hypothetical protein
MGFFCRFIYKLLSHRWDTHFFFVFEHTAIYSQHSNMSTDNKKPPTGAETMEIINVNIPGSDYGSDSSSDSGSDDNPNASQVKQPIPVESKKAKVKRPQFNWKLSYSKLVRFLKDLAAGAFKTKSSKKLSSKGAEAIANLLLQSLELERTDILSIQINRLLGSTTDPVTLFPNGLKYQEINNTIQAFYDRFHSDDNNDSDNQAILQPHTESLDNAIDAKTTMQWLGYIVHVLRTHPHRANSHYFNEDIIHSPSADSCLKEYTTWIPDEKVKPKRIRKELTPAQKEARSKRRKERKRAEQQRAADEKMLRLANRTQEEKEYDDAKEAADKDAKAQMMEAKRIKKNEQSRINRRKKKVIADAKKAERLANRSPEEKAADDAIKASAEAKKAAERKEKRKEAATKRRKSDANKLADEKRKELELFQKLQTDLKLQYEAREVELKVQLEMERKQVQAAIDAKVAEFAVKQAAIKAEAEIKVQAAIAANKVAPKAQRDDPSKQHIIGSKRPWHENHDGPRRSTRNRCVKNRSD